MMDCSSCELSMGEELYKEQHIANKFFFLLRGEMHLVLDGDDDNISKILEEGQFFGFRDDPFETRNEIVTAKSQLVEVIEIDTFNFKEIIQKAK